MKTSFLHSVSDELIRRFGWEGLKDITLVFPMHRAGVVMRSELQQRMAADHVNMVWSPEMMALGDLFDSLCPLGKEDELFTVCRLHRIYNECVQQASDSLSADHNGQPLTMDIDRFYSWGRQLLSDFTNIDQGLEEKDIDSFFRNALTLSDLDTYKLDDDVRKRLEDLLYKGEAVRQSLIAQSVQAHFAALWKAMPSIYKQLRQEMQQAGKGYEGQRMRYVITHWDELRQRAQSKVYCFIGFNYLLPVERQLMQLLHAEQRALFFWDYVEDFHANSKAFAFIRQNMKVFPNALPTAIWGAPRHVRTISVTSTHAEAEYAGQWLQDTYKKRGESTAIVICDEAQLEAVIYGLPLVHAEGEDKPEEINITKGFPLRHTAVYSDLIKQLDKAFRAQKDNPTAALQSVLPYMDELSARSLAHRQNTWQWHLEREAIYQSRRTLVQFITILQDGIVSDLAAHPELLRRLVMRHMEQISLPFHGEPITDLQIMGVLETRTLDFDHLLLLNVEEGVLPAHQPDKSFLPYYLRKAYGLQTHDERASVYAYNFFRLLQRANDVTILFSQSQTAMTKKSMSRFVMQMLVASDEFVVDKYVLTESNTLQPASAFQVPDDASWLQASMQAGKSPYLSPSAINTFYTCKRKFYLEYMRGLREDDVPETIFSNRTLGLFVHEAIHYLYENYCHCHNGDPVQIQPEQIAKFNTPACRRQALEVAYERLNANYIEMHPESMPIYRMEEHVLENSVIDTYIEHVLLRDSNDAERYGLTILLLEGSKYATMQIPTQNADATVSQKSDATVSVSLGGRVDRMDQIGGKNGFPEVTRIVDYKCGKYDSKKMNANFADLRVANNNSADYVRQTLLYSFVMHARGEVSSLEPHLYFTSQDLTDPHVQTRVAVDQSPITYDDQHDEQYSSLIADMLGDIIAEREFAPCPECSPYCPFLRLCGRKAKQY